MARGQGGEVVCSNALADRDEEEIEGVPLRRLLPRRKPW
jgi:hypothetical protein